jgi:hypothetical protein
MPDHLQENLLHHTEDAQQVLKSKRGQYFIEHPPENEHRYTYIEKDGTTYHGHIAEDQFKKHFQSFNQEVNKVLSYTHTVIENGKNAKVEGENPIHGIINQIKDDNSTPPEKIGAPNPVENTIQTRQYQHNAQKAPAGDEYVPRTSIISAPILPKPMKVPSQPKNYAIPSE